MRDMDKIKRVFSFLANVIGLLNKTITSNKINISKNKKIKMKNNVSENVSVTVKGNEDCEITENSFFKK